jgi:hypothetical protein
MYMTYLVPIVKIDPPQVQKNKTAKRNQLKHGNDFLKLLVIISVLFLKGQKWEMFFLPIWSCLRR